MATMKEASAGKLVRAAAVRDAKKLRNRSCLYQAFACTYKLILIFRNNLNVYH